MCMYVTSTCYETGVFEESVQFLAHRLLSPYGFACQEDELVSLACLSYFVTASFTSTTHVISARFTGSHTSVRCLAQFLIFSVKLQLPQDVMCLLRLLQSLAFRVSSSPQADPTRVHRRFHSQDPCNPMLVFFGQGWLPLPRSWVWASPRSCCRRGFVCDALICMYYAVQNHSVVGIWKSCVMLVID